jgi:pantothenate kinase
MTAENITVAALASHILQASGQSQARLIVALAGAPGSGKSTLAEDLCNRLNANRPGLAAILPMDGYHFDDGLLRERGRLAHKGAPDTFDVGGFAHTLHRLRRADEAEVAVPVFDRSLEISRGSARMISQNIPVIIAEGNYLLLQQAPWTSLRPLYDITVKLETSEETLRSRLEARWRGFGLAEADVARKVEDNDLPNARFVLANSGGMHLVLHT